MFVLHRLGLTSQLQNERVLATNRASNCARVDRIETFADKKQEQSVHKESAMSKKVAVTKEENITTPPRPKAPASLLKWNQMLEIKNQAIFSVESERNDVYMELVECKGIFKAGKRKKLQEEYDIITKKIDNMKVRLGKIVQGYGYKTVDEFYRLFNSTVEDYDSYQKEIKSWEAKYGENSIQRKLAEKQAEIRKQQEEREHIYQSPTNRGAR